MAEPVKWTLQITLKKGGSPTYRVSNGKAGFNVPLAAICFRAEDATQGCEVLVETKSGQPIKVTIPGKPEVNPRPAASPAAPRASQPRVDHGGRGGPHHRSGGRPSGPPPRRTDPPPRRDATAPYNFVTAESPLAFAEPAGETRYSGSIACSAEALTPLLVAGPQDRDPGGRSQRVPERRFFTVAGRPVIPGSSLKGMIRAAVEALSRAPMRGLVSQTTIGTRDVSAPESRYSQRFQAAIAENRLRAGFLEQRGADHVIMPCEFAGVRLPELGLRVQKNSSATQIAADARGHSKDLRIWFTIAPSADPTRPHLASAPRFATGGKPPSGGLEGQLVPTGGMPLGDGRAKDKGYVFFAAPPGTESLPVDDEIVQAFEDQRTPPQNELLAFYREHGLRVPVFFLVESGKIAAYGLCRFFRIKTAHSPSELASRLSDHATDRPMSELLFGSVGAMPRRGRVRCSIGTFDSKPATNRFPPERAVVAGNPAASAVTMYLSQDSDGTFCRDGRNRALVTYDDERPVLRGRKLYWHRHETYAPPLPNDNTNVQAIYHPLAAGATFTFTVSFERLTLTQLGALCEAIDYPAGHAHKLGLGKPFGLGSVRLNVDWKRSNIAADRERYTSLARRLRDLADPGRIAADSGQDSSADIATQARAAFHGAVTTADRTSSTGGFENLPHVRQFRALTNWDRPPAPNEIAYMPLSSRSRDRDEATYAVKPILEDAASIERPAAGR